VGWDSSGKWSGRLRNLTTFKPIFYKLFFMESKFAERADEILERAQLAAAEFHQFNQQETDRIDEAVFKAGFNNRVILAKMAQEETGMGVGSTK
jgi:hypothetical protein